MRRGSIGERPEPTQQLAFLCPKAGDIAFRSRQHRQKAEQQHLFKRVDHLATLPRVRKRVRPRVRKRSEMIKKNNRLTQSPYRLHRAAPLPNQRLPDSELYPVVTSSFTRLPCRTRFGPWRTSGKR